MSKYDNPGRLDFCKRQRTIYGWYPFIRTEIPKYVKLGVQVTLFPGVLFTEGFGYARDKDGRWLHIPHIGGVDIGNNVDIFPMTTINRGVVEDTIIGEGTKIDHHCHIGHNSKIGKDCLICAGVVIAGSVEIGDNVWIGPNSNILNKAKVGNDCYVAMGSNVVSNIPEHSMVKGNPARWEYREELPHIKIG